MKKTKLIALITGVLAVVGIGSWYVVTDRQTVEKNNQQANNTEVVEVTETSNSKFATLTGEAFDEAYIADMLAHHEGAINMSEMVGAATERQALIKLAQSIMETQSQEYMQMLTWQKEWGYEKTIGGHGTHGGEASDASSDMVTSMVVMTDALMGLKGEEFDKYFLALMIEHHQQAVEMSKFADTNASHQEIKDIAKEVISAQEAEIAQMKQWQKEWGLVPTEEEMSSKMPSMNH